MVSEEACRQIPIVDVRDMVNRVPEKENKSMDSKASIKHFTKRRSDIFKGNQLKLIPLRHCRIKKKN